MSTVPSTPHVSVIALCFNTGRYVVEALESLMHQTYDSFEVIVVDDGSTDDSVEQIAEWIDDSPFPTRLLKKQENEGIPAALNTGIGESSGSIVTWLSDDLWDPDRLERVVACFDEAPQDVGVVFGDAIVIDATGTEIGELRPPESLVAVGVAPGPMDACEPGAWVVLGSRFMSEGLLHRCFIPAPTASVRRSCYDLVGPYDESLAIEDLDFWLRAASVTKFAYLRAPLVRYRKHERNFTSGASGAYLEALRKTLRKHQLSDPHARQAASRHLREEAFRITLGLLATRRLRLAVVTIARFYFPNLQATKRCAKETLRLVAAVGSAMISIHPRQQEWQS